MINWLSDGRMMDGLMMMMMDGLMDDRWMLMNR